MHDAEGRGGAVHDVVDEVGADGAGFAGHGGSVSGGGIQVKKYV